jgi:hypothetical protein
MDSIDDPDRQYVAPTAFAGHLFIWEVISSNGWSNSALQKPVVESEPGSSIARVIIHCCDPPMITDVTISPSFEASAVHFLRSCGWVFSMDPSF